MKILFIKTWLPNRYIYSLKMYMLKLSYILLFLGFVKFSWQDKQVPKVSTFTGNIRGYYKKSRSDRLYEAYEGIPYAQSPVGKFRFQVC